MPRKIDLSVVLLNEESEKRPNVESEKLPNVESEKLANVESEKLPDVESEKLPNMESGEDFWLNLDLNKVPDNIPDEEDNGEWSAENILDKHEKDGVIEYLVKWKGNPVEPESWIASTYLTNMKMLVEEFDKRTGNPEKEILNLTINSDSKQKKRRNSDI